MRGRAAHSGGAEGATRAQGQEVGPGTPGEHGTPPSPTPASGRTEGGRRRFPGREAGSPGPRRGPDAGALRGRACCPGLPAAHPAPWQADLCAGQQSQGPRTRLPAEDGHRQRGPECAHGKPRQADLSDAHGSTRGRSCRENPEPLTAPPSTPAPPVKLAPTPHSSTPVPAPPTPTAPCRSPASLIYHSVPALSGA